MRASRVLLCLALAAAADAQTISYVASIRRNVDPDAKTLSEYSPGGRFTATAITAAALIRMAYRVQPFQLAGAPAWLAERRYDIVAKVEDVKPPALQALLEALLKDRFGLQVHRETREMPVFALRVARADGKLGPALAESAFDCAAYLGGPHPPPQPGKTPPCATRIIPGLLSGKAIPMSRLAGGLSALVERSVIDRTELAGAFDVELTWTSDDAGPSIYTALVEQLGLRLVAERGPVEALVVDRIVEPSGN